MSNPLEPLLNEIIARLERGVGAQALRDAAVDRHEPGLAQLMLGTQSARLVTVSPLLNRYWKKLRRWVGGVLSRDGGLRVVSRWRKATVSLGAIALNSTSASPKRKLRNRSAKRQQWPIVRSLSPR